MTGPEPGRFGVLKEKEILKNAFLNVMYCNLMFAYWSQYAAKFASSQQHPSENSGDEKAGDESIAKRHGHIFL